jgi:hypothetical protein
VLERRHEHIDPHDHALAPTERVVVRRAVLISGVLADVVQVEVEQAGFAGAFDDGDVERPLEGIREEGEDVDSQFTITIHDSRFGRSGRWCEMHPRTPDGRASNPRGR